MDNSSLIARNDEVTSLVKKHEKEDEAKGRVNQQRGTTFVRSQLIKSSGANIGETYESRVIFHDFSMEFELCNFSCGFNGNS